MRASLIQFNRKIIDEPGRTDPCGRQNPVIAAFDIVDYKSRGGDFSACFGEDFLLLTTRRER